MKNTPTTLRRLRCAVYTHKSTEEGLEREYNSIDAQSDAGQAFIASRRAEGWIGLDDEDGIGAAPGPIVLPSSGVYTQGGVVCANDGRAVRGFIDWNRGGDFNDASEASVPAVCAGGVVDVSWAAPAATLAGPSYMSLRIATTAVEVAVPVGVARSGEVEDYAVSLVPSQITLVKQLNGRMTIDD
ncbi:GEVED domain-containing protein [Lysobacter antibioticus]|uniref:GEVED domain-containing protein n=1 Tax=Lysobacter antibioticus TaxID=84531 RepID=UPI0004D017E0|nr:GEVED domain-containing protein [Lysobacter antibioticus]